MGNLYRIAGVKQTSAIICIIVPMLRERAVGSF